MRRAFRFAPPEVARALLTRPRLVRALVGRWEHRLTILVGGPGLGKTTLLIQAIVENRLAPRGHDVWLGVEPRDAEASHLSEALLEAIVGPSGGRLPRGDPVEAIAAAVWTLAPSPVCLVLDDVHLLPVGSGGLDVLERLVEILPDNGHVLLASRTPPALRVARLAATGALLELGEDELLLNEAELGEFAALRGIDEARLGGSGGWPALVELAARGEPQAGAFVWEEVIEPLGEERREVLAVLCDLGGADEALMAAALARPVDLDVVLRGIPLVAASSAGWHVPHPLWQSVAGVRLAPEMRSVVRRRAVAHLVGARRYDDAFELLAEDELWDLGPGVLRDACLIGARPVATELDGWVRRCPDHVLATPAGRLAVGVRAEMTDPEQADGPLLEAVAGFRAIEDLEGEVTATTHLGRVAWWRQDLGVFAALVPRVAELAATENRAALALDRIGRAFMLDLIGDDDGMWDSLAAVQEGSGDPWWDAVVAWLRSLVLMSRGDARGALEVLDIGTIDDPVLDHVLVSARALAHWVQGDVDRVAHSMAALVAIVEATGVAHNIALQAGYAAQCLSYVGMVDAARPFLARARGSLREARANAVVRVRIAEASVELADGDEDAAAATLRSALERDPLEQGTTRRVWRDSLPLTYVLVPETRPTWDALALGGFHASSRDLAGAVAAGRPPRGAVPPEHLDVSNVGAVRAALHYRFAAELAVQLHAAHRPEGAALLEALGSPGRSVVRELVHAASARDAKFARGLLHATPAPPASELAVFALGPLEIRRGSEPFDGPELRRQRVRSLLAFLLGHRIASREAVMAALWPDLDDQAAANNLRVTLSHLIRALEPVRPEDEPPYYVRAEGSRLELAAHGLVIDLDVFDAHLRAAHDAERAATPSVALHHHQAVVACYRGELFADLDDAEWFLADRDRYHLRFVESAVRAAELLVAGGEVDGGESLAERVLDRDPWSERACAVLVSASLRRGDRSGALHQLERCFAIARDLGVDPSDDTLRLQRDIRSGRQPTSSAVAPRN